MELFIIFGTIGLIAAGVPFFAIFTDHKQKIMKLKISAIEKELELEQMKLANYEKETEKLRLELEHSKQLLLETKENKDV